MKCPICKAEIAERSRNMGMEKYKCKGGHVFFGIFDEPTDTEPIEFIDSKGNPIDTEDDDEIY